MIESALMRKPMVSVNITGQPNPLPFIDWGFGIEVNKVDELVDAVERVQSDMDFRRGFEEAYQRYFAGSIDGKACRRIADLAYSLI